MKQLILLLFLITGFITWSQVPNYVPSDGLVGWWPFNGNANDLSGTGNDGTNNGATLTTDRFGNTDAAYDFDGDDWISIANSASLNWGLSDYTVSVWVNKNNAAPWLQNIIAKQETTAGDYYGWNLGLVYNDVRFTAGSGYDGSWMNNGNIESDYSISDNQWYLISGVFDLTNSLTSLYINGALNTSTTASGTVNPNNSQDLKFGAYMPSGAPSGPEFFYGKIDDIGIWNRALTECEIQDLYNAELNTPTVDLGNDQTICSGDDLELDAGAGYNYYNWSTGETTQTIIVSDAGTYTATVGDSVGVNNNYSLSFDGVDDYLEFDNSNTNQFPISVSLQFKLNDANDTYNSLFASDENELYSGIWLAASNNSVEISYGDGNGTGPSFRRSKIANTNLNIGQWYFVTAIIESQNDMTIYLNGTDIGGSYSGIGGPYVDLGYPMMSGILIDENGDSFFDNFKLGDLQLWNTALTQSEIQNYMNCPPTGNESGLVGYWNFEEGSGTTVLDQTSNGNNGTINGATYDTDTPEQVCIGCTASADAVVIEAVPTSSTDTQEACESFTWIDGNTYTDDNTTATFVTTNVAGCDSTITLNLTILESSSITDIHEVCEEFTWIDGNTYTEDNSTATFVTANAAGCDSTITLNLTILESSSSTDAHEECPSFTWIDGNTYTESNNTATFITTNTAGCDSVITLNLTINNLTTLDAGANQTVCEGTDVTLTATGAAVYAWDNGIQNGVPFPALLGSNTYNVEGTDANGCEDEQSVTITGTAYPELSFEVADPACQGEASGNAVVVASNGTSPYTFVWNNGALQAENNSIPAGTYEVTVTDNIGCEAQGVVVVIDPSEPCFNIPGGISPNGDGINDTWTIGGLENYPDANVNVFDRWGQAVYTGNATSDAWDGTINGNECPTADYYYILELGDGQKFNGVVTLKR